MKKLLGTMIVLGGLGVVAQAVPLNESESNNTLPSANFVAAAFYPFGAVAVDGSLAAGDVDYYTFDLIAGDNVAVATFDFSGNGEPSDPDSLDTLLGIFAPDSTLFDSDDDDNISFLSAYQFTVPTTGRWGVAVGGFGDENFDGTGSDEVGDYKLVFAINAIPEPSTIALLALGALTLFRRR